MRVSWTKTKIQNNGAQPSDIVVDGNTVEQVDNFLYLSSAQSSDGGSQADTKWRTILASRLCHLCKETGAIDISLYQTRSESTRHSYYLS